MAIAWKPERGPRPPWWTAYSDCMLSPEEFRLLVERDGLVQQESRSGNTCQVWTNDHAYYFATPLKGLLYVDRCPRAGVPQKTAAEPPGIEHMPEPVIAPVLAFGIGKYANQRTMDL